MSEQGAHHRSTSCRLPEVSVNNSLTLLTWRSKGWRLGKTVFLLEALQGVRKATASPPWADSSQMWGWPPLPAPPGCTFLEGTYGGRWWSGFEMCLAKSWRDEPVLTAVGCLQSLHMPDAPLSWIEVLGWCWKNRWLNMYLPPILFMSFQIIQKMLHALDNMLAHRYMHPWCQLFKKNYPS